MGALWCEPRIGVRHWKRSLLVILAMAIFGQGTAGRYQLMVYQWNGTQADLLRREFGTAAAPERENRRCGDGIRAARASPVRSIARTRGEGPRPVSGPGTLPSTLPPRPARCCEDS